MSLTNAQLQTLKVAIETDPILAAKPLNGDGYFDIAAILNVATATPAFFVWRSNVSIAEIMGSGFDWTRVDNMSVGESRIWEYMTQLGFINANQANVRAGVNEAFKGTAQDNAVRLAVFGHCQKFATRTEQIFAFGTGVSSSDVGLGPGTVVVQSITPLDVQEARALL